jgi:hypothetical protein
LTFDEKVNLLKRPSNAMQMQQQDALHSSKIDR